LAPKTAGRDVYGETVKPGACPFDGCIHKLYFLNVFRQSGDAIFKENYRNRAMSAFFATDVIAAQREAIKNKLPAGQDLVPVTKIIRNNVLSTSGAQWMGNNFRTGDMSEDDLESFLTNTDNGKSSVRIAQSMGSKITGGSISGTADKWSVELQLSSANAAASSQEYAEATKLLNELEKRVNEKNKMGDMAIAQGLSQLRTILPRIPAEPHMLDAMVRIASNIDRLLNL